MDTRLMNTTAQTFFTFLAVNHPDQFLNIHVTASTKKRGISWLHGLLAEEPCTMTKYKLDRGYDCARQGMKTTGVTRKDQREEGWTTEGRGILR
jgi:hypothetical protein